MSAKICSSGKGRRYDQRLGGSAAPKLPGGRSPAATTVCAATLVTWSFDCLDSTLKYQELSNLSIHLEVEDFLPKNASAHQQQPPGSEVSLAPSNGTWHSLDPQDTSATPLRVLGAIRSFPGFVSGAPNLWLCSSSAQPGSGDGIFCCFPQSQVGVTLLKQRMWTQNMHSNLPSKPAIPLSAASPQSVVPEVPSWHVNLIMSR